MLDCINQVVETNLCPLPDCFEDCLTSANNLCLTVQVSNFATFLPLDGVKIATKYVLACTVLSDNNGVSAVSMHQDFVTTYDIVHSESSLTNHAIQG